MVPSPKKVLASPEQQGCTKWLSWVMRNVKLHLAIMVRNFEAFRLISATQIKR